MLLSLLQVGFVLGETAISTGTINTALFVLLKLLFVIAGLLYVIFAIIVIRQIHVMQNTLVTTFSGGLKIAGFLHLLLALFVLAMFALTL